MTHLCRRAQTHLHDCFSVRRVKCDEGKPGCLRCSSTGRKCDGYMLANQDKVENSASPASIVRAPSSNIHGSVKECRSFHFFCDRTLPQLSGFYGCEFWDRLVLQATHCEPAIRHGIIALGALHERFENDDNPILRSGSQQDPADFALQQYNLAIKYLIDPFSHKKVQPVDLCLTLCILFTCFEVRYS